MRSNRIRYLYNILIYYYNTVFIFLSPYAGICVNGHLFATLIEAVMNDLLFGFLVTYIVYYGYCKVYDITLDNYTYIQMRVAYR